MGARRYWLRSVSALLLWVSGCDTHAPLIKWRDAGLPLAGDDGGIVLPSSACPAGTSPRMVTTKGPARLDLVFVVDNSPSMSEEQANLAANFPLLMESLKKLPAGMPDLHLGILSTDMGTGTGDGATICSKPGGDRGTFQAKAGCGLDGSGQSFLSQNAAGKNFTGDISEVFACLAQLGTSGCGFEQPLASMRSALSGFLSSNKGFLRPDAHLAVVFITDEDDCSAPASTSFFSGVAKNDSRTSAIACSLVGHDCGGKSPTPTEFSVPLDGCTASTTGGGVLTPVATFVDEMKRLKTQSVTVSVIAGWPLVGTDAEYGYQTEYDQVSGAAYLGMVPVCKTKNGLAGPALRLKQFVDAFGSAGKMLSICQDDFSSAMGQVGELITTTMACR